MSPAEKKNVMDLCLKGSDVTGLPVHVFPSASCTFTSISVLPYCPNVHLCQVMWKATTTNVIIHVYNQHKQLDYMT